MVKIILSVALGLVAVFLILIPLGIHVFSSPARQTEEPTTTSDVSSTTTPVHMPMPVQATPVLNYSFNVDGVLQETGSMSQSTSPYWWVNSGGELVIVDQKGETMQ